MLLPDRRCGASLLVSPVFDRLPRVFHGFSTRALGDAAGLPAGGEAVTRALASAATQWERHGLRQVHGGLAMEAGEATASADPPEADALWTRQRGQLLVIRTADCVPVLLAATGAGGILGVAAVHAGWRGAVAGIVPTAVAALEQAAPARIVAAVGPAIGPCCFEVGPEAAEPLRAAGASLRPGDGDRSFVDLPGLVGRQLAEKGVALPIADVPPCTRCHPELFPSHRREGAAAPRMAAFIGLLPA